MSLPNPSPIDDICAAKPLGRALLPVMAAVFIAFLVIGMALPVLPLYVHQGLGLGTFFVGLIAGSQFAAAILSRVWAGRHSDARGPKRAVIAGLVIAAGGGLVYLLSLTLAARPPLSVTILLGGRALLGIGESFIITGGQSWALSILTLRNTSKAIAWMGSAMFAAFAAGAPLGTFLYARYGFGAVAAATTILPLATVLVILPIEAVRPIRRSQAGFMKVMSSVWIPGAGAALSSVGFGAIIAFSSLLFVARGWVPWPAFSVFALVFILSRLFLGHLADRLPAAKVAFFCVLVEAAGLALIWLLSSYALGLIGAALTGFGYSLVYPGLGVEAVRRVPAQSRGLAMGAYTAFLDIALGFGTPALGLLADRAGLASVFAAGMLAALGAAVIAARLWHKTRVPREKSALACAEI
jgi:MFS family permease